MRTTRRRVMCISDWSAAIFSRAEATPSKARCRETMRNFSFIRCSRTAVCSIRSTGLAGPEAYYWQRGERVDRWRDGSQRGRGGRWVMRPPCPVARRADRAGVHDDDTDRSEPRPGPERRARGGYLRSGSARGRGARRAGCRTVGASPRARRATHQWPRQPRALGTCSSTSPASAADAQAQRSDG